MDFIDASNNNSSTYQNNPQQNNVFCYSCNGKMLYVRKGNLAEKYICESCGTTLDPKTEYISSDTESF